MIGLLTTVLPSLFSLIGWIFGKVKASDDVKAQFAALVKQAEDDMLIPAKARSDFKDIDAKLDEPDLANKVNKA